MVPLFAYGPQSKLFGGVQENSDVSNKILQLLAK
jgi:alkaline phosphatase